MKENRIIWLMSAAIILLAGITMGQHLQLSKQAVSVEDIKAEILAELRSPPVNSTQGQPRESADRQAAGVAPAMPEEPPEPLSSTQYWISTDYSDVKPYGFSSWIVLTPGGNIIVEKCLAPDYSNARVTAEMPTELIPECRQLINATIAKIGENDIALNGGKRLPVKFEQDKEIRKIELQIEGETVLLVPGSKNTLWEHLSGLPSVRLAHKQAWDAHVKLRQEMEKAGAASSKPE